MDHSMGSIILANVDPLNGPTEWTQVWDIIITFQKS